MEDSVTALVRLFVRIILIFVGFVLSVVAISLFISFLVFIFGYWTDLFFFDSELVNISLIDLSHLFIGPAGSSTIFQISFVLLIGLPIAMLLYAGIKLIFGIRGRGHTGITAFYVWLAALIICVFYGFGFFKDFRESASVIKESDTEVLTGRPVEIRANLHEKFDRVYGYGDYIRIDESNVLLAENSPTIFYGLPTVRFMPTESNEIEIESRTRARGRSEEHARERASRIIFKYSATATEVRIDPCFTLDENEVWREQEVDVIIRIPEGTLVKIDEKLRPVISNRHHSPWKLAGETWMMTPNGFEKPTGQTSPEGQGEQSLSNGNNIDESGPSLLVNLTRSIGTAFGNILIGI